MIEEVKCGSWTFELNLNSAPPIWLDVKHYGHYDDKLVAGGYGASLMGRHIWGYGFVSSTELLYLYGVHHALSVCMAQTGQLDPHVEFFVQKAGFTRYFDYFPRWLANGGKNSAGHVPVAYEEIKTCASAAALGNLSFSVCTPRSDFMPEATELAWEAAKVANLQVGNRSPGLINMGETKAALLSNADARG